MKPFDEERWERWRLVLGEPAQAALEVSLGDAELRMDRALAALYDSERKAGLGGSSPHVARWLGDIREYFPSSVVRVMQGDAMTRLGLTEMLLQPELLAAVEPDVSLVATLLSLRKVIPQKTKETARRVVRKVVEDLERRLRAPTERAVRGALSRSSRTRKPRAAEIDWNRTLRANLGNYSPERKSVVVEKLVGHGRKRSSLRDVVLCIDQSGSMAASVVYSSIFGAVLASLRAVSTRMVLFDTSVVDLSEQLSDPVDLLFGTQLGGGTDIDQALAYCQQLITRPAQSILVLITDLYEGGNAHRMLQRAASLVQSGVTVICLLALSDQGAPSHDGHHAAQFAALGIPTFSCTPDLFPELMAAAIQRQDLRAWAARQELQLARPG
ncbi:VWA domain-containing protein [Stigmatella sp. ncwal1]|uniref:VWA domain-containing protein n=1 Tax=Stigmatella ashevillensis TaxID=2995309 RepID=A0ABT5DQ38_9BACT|nr:VWA domain-containing protein [Stigmatella ashevillena]MDC0714858.1 VWA domain-containing protein [Stigmatella ashevillena]